MKARSHCEGTAQPGRPLHWVMNWLGKATSSILQVLPCRWGEHLLATGLLQGQDVTYRMNGAAIRLVRGVAVFAPSRERTVALVRNGLLVAGALCAAIMGVVGWFYWSHSFVTLSIGQLHGITSSSVLLQVLVDDPGANTTQRLISRQIDGDRIRLCPGEGRTSPHRYDLSGWRST